MKRFVNMETRSISLDVAYSDVGSPITIIKLPTGARVKANITITDAFTNPTKFDVGVGSNTTNLINQFDSSADDGKNSDTMILITDTNNDVKISATAGLTLTQGSATVTLEYILPTVEEVSY